jgi:hypothetical protein
VPRILCLLLLASFGAGNALAQAPSCLLSSQKPMVSAELYFGRSIAGRRAVSESEWSGFVERVVAVQFPDGFTVHDGVGEWRDLRTRAPVTEKSKILTIVAPAAADLGPRLQSIADAYKKQFRQQSVGIVTTEACAEF